MSIMRMVRKTRISFRWSERRCENKFEQKGKEEYNGVRGGLGMRNKEGYA